MPTIYEIWVILNSPISINCVARLIRISLINSIGACLGGGRHHDLLGLPL